MTVEVNLYYAEWCGHCQKFKPEWENLKATLDDLGVSHNEYEDDTNKEEIKNAQVDGFPTIRIKVDKDEFDYSGPRTAPAILDYIGIIPDKVDQSGGSTNKSPYEARYLKYKAKYLSLKKWADEHNY